MNKKSTLLQLAIQAAKNQNWTDAVKHNLEIIEIDETDLSALNRLGAAYIQLGDKKKALTYFNKALRIDKANPIAKKHVQKLKNNQKISMPSFGQGHFIEEPGKTKSVELNRLASKKILENLRVGQECLLTPKNRYISVSTEDKVHLGALPEDISFRLTKLIKKGNEYACYVQEADAAICKVFIKELKRSKRNEFTNSFPLSSSNITAINDIDDTFIEDEVPIQIVETDQDDKQKSLSDVDMDLDE